MEENDGDRGCAVKAEPPAVPPASVAVFYLDPRGDAGLLDVVRDLPLREAVARSRELARTSTAFFALWTGEPLALTRVHAVHPHEPRCSAEAHDWCPLPTDETRGRSESACRRCGARSVEHRWPARPHWRRAIAFVAPVHFRWLRGAEPAECRTIAARWPGATPLVEDLRLVTCTACIAQIQRTVGEFLAEGDEQEGRP